MSVFFIRDFLPEQLPEGTKLALVNRGRYPQIWDWISENRAEFCYLYDKEPPQELAGLLPLLINVDDLGFEALPDDLIGQESLVFLFAAPGASVADIAMHLCSLQHVKLPDNRIAWFRFYEPYVLETFLESCDENTAGFVFSSKLSAIVVPDIYSKSSAIYTPPEMPAQPVTPALPLAISSGQFEHILEAQHEKMLRIGVILLEQSHLCHPVNRQSLYEHVVELFDYAMSNGITRYEYVLNLTDFSVAHGLNWHKSDQVKTVFESSASQGEKVAKLGEILRTPVQANATT